MNNKGHLSHLAKEYIFGLRPKPGHTHRFQLIKDYTGHVIEVIDIGQQSVMTAPKGYAIEYSVEEGPGFWSSCTEGGRFFITFHVKPIDI